MARRRKPHPETYDQRNDRIALRLSTQERRRARSGNRLDERQVSDNPDSDGSKDGKEGATTTGRFKCSQPELRDLVYCVRQCQFFARALKTIVTRRTFHSFLPDGGSEIQCQMRFRPYVTGVA